MAMAKKTLYETSGVGWTHGRHALMSVRFQQLEYAAREHRQLEDHSTPSAPLWKTSPGHSKNTVDVREDACHRLKCLRYSYGKLRTVEIC